MTALSFEQITVDYVRTDGQSVRALDAFSLNVAQGESVALIGPSGCGKSTLLRVASGLLEPSAGRMLVGDEVLRAPRPQTALILQDFGLLPWKTVYQNAELGLRIGKVAAGERRDRTRAALEAVGLADFARALPRELSGGMQQRLALARALALDADVLLMDEPLSALDALLRESMQDLLGQLHARRGHTQILVTHSIEEAVRLGTRIVVLRPRPAHVCTSIANPCAEDPGFRESTAFFQQCTVVRAALQGAAGQADGRTAGEAACEAADGSHRVTAAASAGEGGA